MSLPTLPSQPADSSPQSTGDAGSKNEESIVTVLPAPTDHITAQRFIDGLLLRPVIAGLAEVTSVRMTAGSIVIEQVLPPGDRMTPVTPFEKLSAIAYTARILATCHDAGVVHGAVCARNVSSYASGLVVLTGSGLGAQPADDVHDLAQLAWDWWEPGSVDAKTASVLLRAHDDDPRLRPTMAQVSATLADAVRRHSSATSPPAARRVAGIGRQDDQLHVDELRAHDFRAEGQRDDGHHIDAQLFSLRGRRLSRPSLRDHRVHVAHHSPARHRRTAVSSTRRSAVTSWVQGVTRRGIIRGCVIAVGSSLATMIAMSGLVP